MQRSINEDWPELQAELAGRLPNASSIEWRSPLKVDDFAEYRDETFLQLLDLGHLAGALKEFWPKSGPQWDALGVSDAGHVLLVEAKAHIGEFCSPPSQAASPVSIAMIAKSLQATAEALSVRPEKRTAWGQYFYQYSNRFAHLHWLRSQGVDAKLLLVGFVGDAEMPGETTQSAWEATYKVANYVLGIGERYGLSKHVLHIHPDVKSRL